jgi:hypothetical protein
LGLEKNPKSRDIAKEAVDEQGKHYVTLPFRALIIIKYFGIENAVLNQNRMERTK